MAEIGSRRDYIETDLLRIVSSYGGETILSGPRMQAMQGELADLIERWATVRGDYVEGILFRLAEAIETYSNDRFTEWPEYNETVEYFKRPRSGGEPFVYDFDEEGDE